VALNRGLRRMGAILAALAGFGNEKR